MPFSRRRFRRSRGPSKVRAREWIGYNTVLAATGAPTAQVSMVANSVYANYILAPDEMTTLYDEPTLLRSILRWSAALEQSTQSVPFFGWGLIALDIEAGPGTLPAAVLPYVPLPFFDSDSPWIYEWHSATAASAVTVPRNWDALLSGSGEVDIKTRRKFPNGFGLALIAYYNNFNAGNTLEVTFSGRLLFANR